MRSNALLLALAVLCALPARAEDDWDVAPLVAKPKPKGGAPKKADPKKPAGNPMDDDVAPLTPAPPRPRQAVAAPQLQLKLGDGVTGATWTLDGKDKGAVPAGPVDVPAGEHAVTVSAPGFEDFSGRFKATAGATATLAATLAPTPGILSLTLSPSDADVLVDGVKVEGNLKRFPLPAGDHTLTVRRKGMAEYEEVVAIVAGGQKQLSVKLKPLAAVRGTGDRPEPRKLTPSTTEPAVDPFVADAEVDSPREPAWYQRWYVWAGVAAVAAGATAAVVVATTPGTPPASSVVCNGRCDAVLNAPPGTAAVQF